jgi:hypothetical protein
MSLVYLLHFDRPLAHARHYLGFTESDDLTARISLHRSGRSRVPIMTALYKAGIGFSIARVWTGGTRTFERSLKERSGQGGRSRICPACSGDSAYSLAIYSPRRTVTITRVIPAHLYLPAGIDSPATIKPR